MFAKPVMINNHKIIDCLYTEQLTNPLKLIVTTFQVKDCMIHAESYSTVDIENEV